MLLGREPELLVSRVPNLTPHENDFISNMKLAPRPNFYLFDIRNYCI